MEFIQLILEIRYFFANSLRSSNFYKSEAKISVWDWIFLNVFFISYQASGLILKTSYLINFSGSVFFSNFLFDEYLKNHNKHQINFCVKFDYEISKIAKKTFEISGMVKEIASFAVSKVSYFSMHLVLTFLWTHFSYTKTCILSFRYWNNRIPLTPESIFNEQFN